MTDQKLGAFALVLDSQGDNQSPDHHEIWLTLARLDPGYMDWLKGNNRNVFLPVPDPKTTTMRQEMNFAGLSLQDYGPFLITQCSHMEKLAEIIVCLAMQATSDIKDAK
ncbi:hypothetical protein N7465_003973 [Penicillium sp. CMV-2018d]|nr:hypothetical protein N7465_003973 [Penicillium sp. CMV-2018d]